MRPQVSGVITQVLFTEGQLVKKGQLLATIDPRSFEIALQQAIGARMRDEAQLENAKVQLQRYQTLLQQDSIARQDVDTQLAAVRQLEATIVIDRANENTARLNLGYTRITAPAAGRIGLRVIDAGNLISANDAGGIAVITQLAPIDVEFSVPQDRVPEIQARVAAGAKLPVTAFDRTRTTVLGEGVFSTLETDRHADRHRAPGPLATQRPVPNIRHVRRLCRTSIPPSSFRHAFAAAARDSSTC